MTVESSFEISLRGLEGDAEDDGLYIEEDENIEDDWAITMRKGVLTRTYCSHL